MNISLRLLIGYFLIVGLSAWFVLNIFSQEIKPGVRQAMEDTLVDTANLLAEVAAQQMPDGTMTSGQFDGQFSALFQRYLARNPHARIWQFKKEQLDLRVYITDTQGIVRYDSSNEAVGQDYSRWNDVYLTLRGRYGVRSTPSHPGDDHSTVMHVAAPINYQGQLVGVLTVAKPTASVQPFIDHSRQSIEQAGWLLMLSALIIGLLFSWWLKHSIDQLRHYAREVSRGQKISLPSLGSRELAELGLALREMREKLDGREYVENYVHHLVHEMKSPLTALIGSAELLDEKLPPQERARFTANIREQSIRLRTMLDKLLALARVEHRNELEGSASINLQQLAEQVIADQTVTMRQRGITCKTMIAAAAEVEGEVFLLHQALTNLLDNAIDFSADGSRITLSLQADTDHYTLLLHNPGPAIPDYAMPRIFERFYSLARPGSRRKSSGLGLPFVHEVALLHGGEISLHNMPQGGVEARLLLPRKQHND